MAHISKEKAKSLAVAYSAYNEARKENNENSIWVWAKMLQKAQKAAGVELVRDEHLEMELA
jgi:hypothetical protein